MDETREANDDSPAGNRERQTIGKSRGYPTGQREPKHSNRDLAAQFFPMLLYCWPALYVVVDRTVLARPVLSHPFQTHLSVVAVASILAGVALFPVIHAKSGKWEPTNEPPSLDLTTVETTEESLPDDIDALESEYKSILAEARFRDKLLLQTSYFSIAVIGLLGAVFVNTPEFLKPFVLMVGSLVLLAFAIAVNSYKDSRDALWDRAGRIECLIPEYRGILTSFNTIRQFDRRLFNRLSLSVYSFGLIVFMLAITVSGYLYVLFVEIPT